MVNQSKRAGLGRTLIKAQKFANQRRNPRKSDKHTTENVIKDNTGVDLRSVTAQTNLDQFFEEAELAGKQFVTERRNLILIDENNDHIDLYTPNEKLAKVTKLNLDSLDAAESLSVPRRPKWDASTTPEALAELEKLSFLTWRKKLAKLQENDKIVLTPFEKNIEVWRQLWRVVERSDIVVQILDCRNPLLYLCDDLIKYVNEAFEGKKTNLILLNKADFLTTEQRRFWYNYFKERGLKTIFFSALLENDNIFKSSKIEEEQKEPDEKTESSYQDENDVTNRLQDCLNLHPPIDSETKIYNKHELLDTWHDLLVELEELNSTKGKTDTFKIPETESDQKIDQLSESSRSRLLTVGLVGYPNVGKSSTINALLSAKRTAVSATPGKTKHFQTFLIDRDMMLCDCPGLVFPNFVNSKSEMVINGILPIDQMKDYVGPVRIIVERIPRRFFEDIYGLAFDQDAKQNIIAEDLLNAFGFMRGYMTARGLPDISRASRKICKDYINGKILYCVPPPNVDPKIYHSHSKLADAMARINDKGKDRDLSLKITERQRRLMAQAKGTDISAAEFDDQYFKSRLNAAHIKGLPSIGDMTHPIGSHSEIKVHKREKKHKKKEKLRKVYRHLDI